MVNERPTKKAKKSTELPLPNPYGRGTRLLITLLPILVILLARQITLPGLDFIYLRRIHNVVTERVSIVALGIAPIMTATLMVEIVAALVPRWRHLRHGGTTGRAKLQQITDILTVVVALYQSYALATLLQDYVILFNRGTQSVLFLMTTLTAGTMALKYLADFVSARGLVNGYGLFIGAAAVLDAGEELISHRASFAPTIVLFVAVKIAAIALLTWFLLEKKHSALLVESVPISLKEGTSEQESTDPENPYAAPGEKSQMIDESKVHASSSSLVLLGPAAGIAPYSTVLSAMAIPATLVNYFSLGEAGDPLRDDRIQIFGRIFLIPLLTVFLTWLFQQPRRVADVYSRLPGKKHSKGELEGEAKNALHHAAAYALIFTFGLFLIDLVARKYAKMDVVTTTGIVVLTAVFLDLKKEYATSKTNQDLIPIWPEHRPYALAAARSALEREGISVHIRNEKQRRILQFSAAYVPMEICVPQADAEKALKILSKVLLAKREDELREAETYAPVQSRRYASIGYGFIVAIAALGLATLYFSIPDYYIKEPKPVRVVNLEFVLVDDDRSITDEIKDTSSQHENAVRIDKEQVSIGLGKMAVRDFAFVTQADGESLDAARLRLEKWLKSIPLPAGSRAALSEYQEFDQDSGTAKTIGWRTYLLKGEAIIKNADVREAQAMPDPSRETIRGWLVRLTFTSSGASRFEQVTGENIKRRFAILVDGLVKSAPVIQTKIPGGVATITMGSSNDERQRLDAESLANALNGD